MFENKNCGVIPVNDKFKFNINIKPVELNPEEELKHAILILQLSNNIDFSRTLNILNYSLAEIERENLSNKIREEVYGCKSSVSNTELGK